MSADTAILVSPLAVKINHHFFIRKNDSLCKGRHCALKMKFKSYYLEKVMMQKHPLPSQSDYFVLKKCFQGFYFNLVLRFHFIIWSSENYFSPFVNYLCQKPFRGKEIFNNFFNSSDLGVLRAKSFFYSFWLIFFLVGPNPLTRIFM